MPSSDFAFHPTVTLDSEKARKRGQTEKLAKKYQQILASQRLNWTVHHHLARLLGTGGQGAVYLSDRRGADGFTIPVAIKVFSPEGFENEKSFILF